MSDPLRDDDTGCRLPEDAARDFTLPSWERLFPFEDPADWLRSPDDQFDDDHLAEDLYCTARGCVRSPEPGERVCRFHSGRGGL